MNMVCIELYRIFINNQIQKKNPHILKALHNIYEASKDQDIYLVCWCHPLPCHADVIKEIIEQGNFK